MKKRRILFDETEITLLKNEYASIGATACAAKLGRSADTIRHTAKRLGLKVSRECRTKEIKTRPRKPDTKRKVPAQRFINPTQPIEAYVLGLLWADGCINANPPAYPVSFATTHPDADHFIKIFKQTGDWCVWSWQPKVLGWRRACKISTTNIYLASHLASVGYEAKSHESASTVLATIPEHLHRFWFLGLLDGDGTVHVNVSRHSYRVAISSSYEQNWDYLEHLCQKLNVDYHIGRYHNKKGHSSSVLQTSNMTGAIRLLAYLYEDNDVHGLGLPRKYTRFLLMKERYNRPECKARNYKRQSSL